MPKQKITNDVEADFIEESVDDLSFSSPMDTNGVYMFSEEFTYSSVSNVIKFILNKNLLTPRRRPKNITLIIMSDGGDLFSCLGLIDVIKGSQIPVHTVGLGSIASCGFLTFIAGEPGHRTITSNTSIMCHQFSWSSSGKVHELLAADTERQRLEKRMMAHIKQCTKLKTDDEIRKYLLPASDVYLEAKEAVKLGVADRITTYYPY
jgi:ATP-dependent Clp protease protease subunit